MLSVAAMAPATGLKHAFGLFRVTMSYLTLLWQAEAHEAAARLGPGAVWRWLTPADFGKAAPG